MARSFAATTDSLIGSAPASLIGYTGAFTICGWANPVSITAATFPGFGFDGTNRGALILLSAADNGLGTRWGGLFQGIGFASSLQPTLSLNTWTHLGFNSAGSGGAWNLYQNGTLVHSGSSSYNALNAGDKVSVANGSASSGTFSLADFGIWTAQLTAQEIAALANGARPYKIRTGSLVSWYPIDGLASPEPDLSGDGFTGTLSGTALVPGPPTMMFTPRWPQTTPVGAAASSVVFRRSLSALGTRTGSRQVQL